jgi:glycosyltransferase involved in cell wall biosynthesis
MAPKYNEEIYTAIDQKFDCTFIIGNQRENIKEMDFSLLSNYYMPEHKIIFGKFSFEKGALSKLFSKQIDIYITTMEPYNITLWLLKLYCLFKRKKIFYWTHGWYGKETLLKRIIKKIDYKTTSGFLLYGNYAKNLMIAEGFSKDNLYVIHNSLNYSRQLRIRRSLVPKPIYKEHFNNTYPTLIFIGRLTKVKELDRLLKALLILKENGDYYNLIFVGDGDERCKLETLAMELSLTENVWFYGACYDEGINAELIYNADLCVAPGNIGLTAIHSLAFGCPAMSHNDFKWQMPEFEAIKPGLTGNFFERHNTESIASAIKKWFTENKFNRDKIRIECFKEIDSYWNPNYEIEVLTNILN